MAEHTSFGIDKGKIGVSPDHGDMSRPAYTSHGDSGKLVIWSLDISILSNCNVDCQNIGNF